MFHTGNMEEFCNHHNKRISDLKQRSPRNSSFKSVFKALINTDKYINVYHLYFPSGVIFYTNVFISFFRWPVGDLFSLFQMKQRAANQVDLWLSNPFPVPLIVLNASLSEKLQGVMKVGMHYCNM